MNLSGKKVAIIGAARSGQAAARLVHKLQGKPRISEQGSSALAENNFLSWAKEHEIPMEWNGHTKNFIENSDLVVLSPGVRIDAVPAQWAKAKGIPVIGEIELAAQLCRRPIIAVTGSNGKTTVVTLIARILEKAGKRVRLCGNVGFPFCDYVLDLDNVDYIVLEISSFQLETIVDFKPHVAVLLNISQNHLDRHQDLEEYFSAKKRIFENQDRHDHAILNAGHERLKNLAPLLKSSVSFFNIPSASRQDFPDQWQAETQLKEMLLKQNQPVNPNFLAAGRVAQVLGVGVDVCQNVFATFPGVEHRMEKVRTIDGIDFVNDSKATTAEAGRWAIENIHQPIVMICGGRDKNIDFTVLTDLVRKKVKRMIVIGEAKAKLKKSFAACVEIEECGGMEEAVSRARMMASPGDCVLLSPMCASFDMFKNFEERGKVFKEIVKGLN